MDWKQVRVRNLGSGRIDTCWSHEVQNYPKDQWEVLGEVKAAPPTKAAKAAPAPKEPKPKEEDDRYDPIDRLPLAEIEELKMPDLMEYAKGFGIKTFGRKKVDILREIEDTESYLKE